MITILYDGWPLVYRPNSSAALHLLSLLAYLPSEVKAFLALPAPSPHSIPESVQTQIMPAANTEISLLRWEQRILPKLANELGINLLHLTSSFSPLFGTPRSVISPTEFLGGWFGGARREGSTRIPGRLREALGQGGMTRARGIFWPNDLPAPSLPAPVIHLPPVVHPAFCLEVESGNGGRRGGDVSSIGESGTRTFRSTNGNGKRDSNGHGVESFPLHPRLEEISSLDLPETYVLYHGPGTEKILRSLLTAWSWAAGSIGEYYPLLALGLDEKAQARLMRLANEYNLGGTVRVLPPLTTTSIAKLYHGCSALLHTAPVAPWGGAVRLALACGKPVVAWENPLTDALVGPAAYLVSGEPVKGDSSRALGAALLTVIVEENVSEALSKKASQRAAGWEVENFSSHLLEGYRSTFTER